MRKASLAIVALVCFGLAGLAGGAAQTKAQTKKPTATTAKSGKSTKKSTTSAKGRAQKPSTQRSPDPARIREIQEALALKGYDVEVSGAWGPQSVEALKKFQEDKNINNLTGRGKLDSLTLIALGLGPPRSPAVAAPTAAEPAADPKQP